MAIVTYPLNGIDYDAENAETYLCTRISGVYSADGNFQASVTGDRQVSISSGLAWIQNTEFAGKSVCNTESVAVEIPIADGTRPRLDRIVLRFDKAANASSIVLKQGTPSSAPIAPAVERTELVYELGLCTVQVPAASTIVNAGNVTSTLLDESVCGLMRDGVTGIPTEQLQEQVTTLLADLRVAFENQLDLQEQDFDAWFETIKGKLGDDPATALQSQVDNLQAAVGGMPLELSVGTNSIQITSAANRIESVTINGFTMQTGSGSPSPSNIRPIENAGADGTTFVDVNGEQTQVTLHAPLHEGDTLQTNVLYQGAQKCVETHTRSVKVLTGSENLTATTVSERTYFALPLTNAAKPTSVTDVTEAVCNALQSASQNALFSNNYSFCISSGRNLLFYLNATTNTVQQAQALLAGLHAAGTPLTVEYPLAQPEVYASDPVELENPTGACTLAGESGTTLAVALTPPVGSVNGKSGAAVTLTKADVGLANVDNTPDAQKNVKGLVVEQTDVITGLPTGLYYYKANTPGAPSTVDGLLLVLVYGTFGVQLAFPTNSGIFFRWAVNHWSEWARLDQQTT